MKRFPLLKIQVLLVLAAGLCTSLVPPLALAAGSGPSIDDVQLREGRGSILLTTSLTTELDEHALEAIRGGVPLVFRYRVRLSKKGNLLGEKIIRDSTIVNSLQYNPIQKQYVFTGEGYGEERQSTTRDEREALEMLKVVDEWPLFPTDKLKGGIRYRVRVMATLKSVEMPSVLGYLFFFTSIFNRETPWKQVDFTY